MSGRRKNHRCRFPFTDGVCRAHGPGDHHRNGFVVHHRLLKNKQIEREDNNFSSSFIFFFRGLFKYWNLHFRISKKAQLRVTKKKKIHQQKGCWIHLVCWEDVETWPSVLGAGLYSYTQCACHCNLCVSMSVSHSFFLYFPDFKNQLFPNGIKPGTEETPEINLEQCVGQKSKSTATAVCATINGCSPKRQQVSILFLFLFIGACFG